MRSLYHDTILVAILRLIARQSTPLEFHCYAAGSAYDTFVPWTFTIPRSRSAAKSCSSCCSESS
jgi:hypothetical protein